MPNDEVIGARFRPLNKPAFDDLDDENNSEDESDSSETDNDL